MLDFPNSPTIGQVFASGSASWVWDGVKWKTGGSSALYMPDAPNDGTLYGRKNLNWSHVTHADITDWTASLSGYALLASPTFTGTPAAPTVTPSTDSTTKLATTAFVQAAIAGITGGGGPFLPLTGGTLSGDLTIAPPSGSAATFQMTGTAQQAAIGLARPAGYSAMIVGSTGTANYRWVMDLGDNSAETGSSAGSNFTLQAYSDSQAASTVFSINRASGTATFSQPNGTGIYNVMISPTTGPSNLGINSVNSNVAINLGKSASGQQNAIQGYTGSIVTIANMRWSLLLGDTVAESTNNIGSNLQVVNYSNSGVYLGSPLTIERTSGFTILSGAGATAIAPPGGLTAGTPSCALRMNKGGSGNNLAIQAYNNGVMRWSMSLGDTTAESGSNAGSNLSLLSYSDAGVNLATPLTINRASGQATFSVAIVNGPSDRRLKENIAPLEDSLSRVLQLQGVSFNMIATPDKPEIGLIAQDVAPIVPEVVQVYPHTGSYPDPHSPPPDMLALDYPKLTALLIEAVKTLSKTDISLTFSGRPSASQRLMKACAVQLSLSENFAGSMAYALTPPSKVTTFIVSKLSLGVTTSLGTIDFAPNSSTATFTGSGGVLAAGDILIVTAPVNPDKDIADVAFAILATRTT